MLLLVTPTTLEKVALTNGAEQTTSYILDTELISWSQYTSLRVDGDRVLFHAPRGDFDLFRITHEGRLKRLRKYSTDLRVGDFDIRGGLLFILGTRSKLFSPRAVFQIVDMNVVEPEVIAEVPGPAGNLTLQGNYAYVLSPDGNSFLGAFSASVIDISDPRNPAAEGLYVCCYIQPMPIWTDTDTPPPPQMPPPPIEILGQHIGDRWIVLTSSHTGHFTELFILTKETPLEHLTTHLLGPSLGVEYSPASRVFAQENGLLVIETKLWDSVSWSLLDDFDVSSPVTPVLVGLHTIETEGQVWRRSETEMCHDMLAVQDGKKSVLLLRLSPRGLTELGRVTLDETIKDIALGPWCYQETGLQFADIEDNPVEVAETVIDPRDPVRLDFDTYPGGDWKLNSSGGSSSVSEGILTIDAPANYHEFSVRHPDSRWHLSVRNSRGWVIETRLRVDAASEGQCNSGYSPALIWVSDHENSVQVRFSTDEICMASPDLVQFPMDTTDGFHVYRIESRLNNVRIYVDGNLVINHNLSRSYSVGSTLLFGDGAGGGKSLTFWDYFWYDVFP